MRRFALIFLIARVGSLLAAEKPNVIYINCDDLGYGDLAEATDVADQHPEIVKRLTDLAELYRTETHALESAAPITP